MIINTSARPLLSVCRRAGQCSTHRVDIRAESSTEGILFNPPNFPRRLLFFNFPSGVKILSQFSQLIFTPFILFLSHNLFLALYSTNQSYSSLSLLFPPDNNIATPNVLSRQAPDTEERCLHLILLNE